MKTSFKLSMLAVPALSLPLLTVVPVEAAPKAKPKPVVKKAAQPKLIREVMGTKQLVGYEGALGQTFTIGRKSNAINFTLNKVEYTIDRVNIGNYSYYPEGDEKLMVLRYTAHNPQDRPINYSYNGFVFKAVDASGVTRNYVGDIARAVTGEPLRIQLQPGQKVDAYTVIKVAAYGPVPKLIVSSYYDDEAPIVRYDLRNKVQKLKPPFVDAADASGATALKQINGVAGTYYPASDPFDVKVDSVSYTTEKLGHYQPDAGERFCVVNIFIKNKGPKPVRVSQSYFKAELKDVDGEKSNWRQSLLKGSRDEEHNTEVAPGEEVKARFHFELPEKVEGKTLLVKYGYGNEPRTYAIELPAAK